MQPIIEQKSNLKVTETDMSLISQCFTFTSGQIRTIKRYNCLKQKLCNSLVSDYKYIPKCQQIEHAYFEVCYDLKEHIPIVDYTPEQHMVFLELRSQCYDKYNQIILCHTRELMIKQSINKVNILIKNNPNNQFLMDQITHLNYQLKIDKYESENAEIEGIKLINQLINYITLFMKSKLTLIQNVKI
jgi:hypothetical protein